MSTLPDTTPAQSEETFSFWPRHNEAIYQRLENKHAWLEEKHHPKAVRGRADDPLEHQMTLNIGPQHPATHGVLRCVVKLDGELIERSAAPSLVRKRHPASLQLGFLQFLPPDQLLNTFRSGTGIDHRVCCRTCVVGDQHGGQIADY